MDKRRDRAARPVAPRYLFEGLDYPTLQNHMYDSAATARACPRGQIRLVAHPETGLVHNAAFDPTLVTYDAAYQNDQGHSPTFARHLDEIADLLTATMGRGPLIEVGCGKGDFLQRMTARGVTITGFDPAYEGQDPRIRKTYFEPGIIPPAEGLILRHVLEHVIDPADFLAGLAKANGGGGLIYIEVPCLDWILRNGTWFDIFYEHVNYFRLSDFRRLFGRTLRAGHCFGGQYLQVIGDLSTLACPVRDPDDTAVFPDEMKPDFDDARSGDVIWGAASKGVIYALLRARHGMPVADVIDINPAKQGRFLAGTGLRVKSPEDVLPWIAQGSRIIVMNPGYLEEIRAMAGPHVDCVAVGP